MAGDRVRAAGDVLLAAALSVISVLLVSTLQDMPEVAYPLALGHTVPLAWRRRAPVRAATVAFTAAFFFCLLGFPMVGLGPAALVWLYTAGAEIERPTSLVLLGIAQAGLAAVIARGGQGDGSTWAGDAVALVVAFLLGDSARRRRDLLALHRDRADQLERTQAEVARRAVAEERLRIARELHDVVAHSMSVIAVQAGTGRLAIDRDPAGARNALVVIEQTSRSALDEMRRLVGVLRGDEADDAGRGPAPGLDGLDELVARTVAGGVPVAVRIEGERRPLPAGLELAAYRILQEALTNVARHAPGAQAHVCIDYGERVLAIEVVNAAAPKPAAGSGAGLGLVGMAERAAVYGGTVDAAPTADGGFRVRAELRLEAR